jgi:hypothetical protein
MADKLRNRTTALRNPVCLSRGEPYNAARSGLSRIK